MDSQKKSLKISLIEITKFLNENSINYALIGGIAYSIFCEPRATYDIDFIVDIENFNDFLKILKKNDKFINIHKEPMKFKNALIERVIYENNIIVDFLIADDEFKRNVLSRKIGIKIDNQVIFIVKIEDLIILKLLSKREQDYLDTKNLLKIQDLDFDYIRFWLEKLKIDFHKLL